jgi:hypothetical protein
MLTERRKKLTQETDEIAAHLSGARKDRLGKQFCPPNQDGLKINIDTLAL